MVSFAVRFAAEKQNLSKLVIIFGYDTRLVLPTLALSRTGKTPSTHGTVVQNPHPPRFPTLPPVWSHNTEEKNMRKPKKKNVSVTMKLNKDGTMTIRSTGGFDLRKLFKKSPNNQTSDRKEADVE